jgi:hypothetical protein
MSLRALAERMVPEVISYEEIQEARLRNQVLHIRLFDNGVFVRNGLRGERRHIDIIEQLHDLRDTGYKLPNTEFKYYTMDTVTRQDVGNEGNSAVFCMFNDEKFDDLPKRILAPTPFFNGYFSGKFGDMSQKIEYQDEMDRITNFSLEKTMPFKEKENALIFKGTVYGYRRKLFNEIKDRIAEASEFLLHERGRTENPVCNREYQNPIENLGKFRYQLVTDGAPRGNTRVRSGTIRSMYMLATGSIVIYISDQGHKKEWWQYAPEAKGLIQYCESVDEMMDIIKHFESNPAEAHELSVQGIDFIKNYLNRDNVNEYWKNLLDVYAERCDFKITKPLGQLQFKNEE